MKAKHIVTMLKEIPTTKYSHLNVCVTNGISEEFHTIVTEDSMVELMFHLSMYGGMIIDLSYEASFNHDYFGFRILDLSIRILKTMTGTTNIDADVIQELSRILKGGN